MFDYVSRREYEQERDRRVAAEAREEELRRQVASLLALLEGDRGKVSADATSPPAPVPPPAFTGDAEPEHKGLTAAQILSIPAVGRRGLAQRQPIYLAALAREQGDSGTKRPVLTDAEKEEAEKTFQGQR